MKNGWKNSISLHW